MGNVTRGLIFLGLMLGCSSQVLADFKLTPGITLREEYDDNVDLDPDNEQDDFITTISPRLSLLWQTKFVDINLNANVNFIYYLDSGDTEIQGGEASTLNSVFDLYRGIVFLDISDTYARIDLDERRSSEDNSRTNKTDTNRLTVNPYLQFVPLSDLQVKLGYSYENLWYGNENSDDGEGDDSESHTFDLVLTKPLSDRITLTMSGSRSLYRPKDAADVYVPDEEGNYEYDRDIVRVGLSYQVSDKLSVEGGYGHSWLDYDVREDSDSDTWDVSADYEIGRTLTTGIAYSLDYTVSVEDGPSERDRLTAYLAYDDLVQIRLMGFMSSESYVEIDRDNESYGGSLNGSIPFSDKAGLDWGLRYTNYDETGIEAEEYDRYGTRLALYYDISMGTLSVGWNWTLNDSDLDDQDYTSNIIYVQASLTF